VQGATFLLYGVAGLHSPGTG